MSYGLRLYNSNGVITLDTNDFTLRSLGKLELAATGVNGGSGVRNDYITWTVPGYDPATCYVIITPNAYTSTDQGYGQPLGRSLPTYTEPGGEVIRIYTYLNYRDPTGVGSDYKDRWIQYLAGCTLEAVRVL